MISETFIKEKEVFYDHLLNNPMEIYVSIFLWVSCDFF